MEEIIGRVQEKKLLHKIEKSADAELVVVYGRGRVGKTFLIRNGFSRALSFEFSGIHKSSLGKQLENFSIALTHSTGGLPVVKPESWLKGFRNA